MTRTQKEMDADLAHFLERERKQAGPAASFPLVLRHGRKNFQAVQRALESMEISPLEGLHRFTDIVRRTGLPREEVRWALRELVNDELRAKKRI